MESDVTQSAIFYKLWAWGDKNKKQLLWGLIAVAVIGVIVAFWLAHKNETQNDANYALSRLTNRMSPTTPEATPDDLLKLAADYPGTDAAQRAQLLAASDLFVQGKYDVAQGQFQKFIQDHNSSPLVSEAALGIAACQDAQGKTAEAYSSYDSVANRYPGQPVVAQAKLAMARLLEAQGKFKEARTTLEDLSHTMAGAMSSEAMVRLQELNAAHPELQPTNTLPQTTAPLMKPVSPPATPSAPMVAPAAPTTNLKTP
jgi:predicted negative regulator of RcsB-dependent stress response